MEYQVSKDVIYDLIAGLDDTKSSGPDGISMKILKAIVLSIIHQV